MERNYQIEEMESEGEEIHGEDDYFCEQMTSDQCQYESMLFTRRCLKELFLMIEVDPKMRKLYQEVTTEKKKKKKSSSIVKTIFRGITKKRKEEKEIGPEFRCPPYIDPVFIRAEIKTFLRKNYTSQMLIYDDIKNEVLEDENRLLGAFYTSLGKNPAEYIPGYEFIPSVEIPIIQMTTPVGSISRSSLGSNDSPGFESPNRTFLPVNNSGVWPSTPQLYDFDGISDDDTEDERYHINGKINRKRSSLGNGSLGSLGSVKFYDSPIKDGSSLSYGSIPSPTTLHDPSPSNSIGGKKKRKINLQLVIPSVVSPMKFNRLSPLSPKQQRLTILKHENIRRIAVSGSRTPGGRKSKNSIKGKGMLTNSDKRNSLDRTKIRMRRRSLDVSETGKRIKRFSTRDINTKLF